MHAKGGTCGNVSHAADISYIKSNCCWWSAYKNHHFNMINLNVFYKKFEDTDKNDRFSPIKAVAEPTSLFVIFQQLTQVRAQKKYFEDRERHLLTLAEEGFRQLEKK